MQDLVAGAAPRTGLEPGRLCVEITEGVLMEDADAGVGAAKSLKALGVRLGIDDFGPATRRSATSGGSPSTR